MWVVCGVVGSVADAGSHGKPPRGHAEAFARRESAEDISRGVRGGRRAAGVAAAQWKSHGESRWRGGNKNKDFGKIAEIAGFAEVAARRHP